MNEETGCAGELEIAGVDEKTLQEMNREELLKIAGELLLVTTPDSGFGFGICKVAGMLPWNTSLAPGEKDWASILATSPHSTGTGMANSSRC